MRQGKLSLFLPSNASRKAHLQFGILAVTGYKPRRFHGAGRTQRTAVCARGADCSRLDPGCTCPVPAPATENGLFCGLKRNPRERKTNHAGSLTLFCYTILFINSYPLPAFLSVCLLPP